MRKILNISSENEHFYSKYFNTESFRCIVNVTLTNVKAKNQRQVFLKKKLLKLGVAAGQNSDPLCQSPLLHFKCSPLYNLMGVSPSVLRRTSTP